MVKISFSITLHRAKQCTGYYRWNFKKILDQLGYAERCENFYSSNLLCICPSLFETNIKKAKYSIYEKLSRVFRVAGSRFEEK